MDIKEICKQYGISPSKSKGQNFLVDENIVNKIATATELEGEIVLEVGPGLGVLTEKLLVAAGKVIAVELDRKIIPFLRNKFKEEIKKGKLDLVEADILSVNLRDLGLDDFNFKLVANLPYSVTSKVFRLFLELGPKPNEIVVMIQKEVAQRMVALPGGMNLLALSAQFYSEPKILFGVGRNCFWPAPEVDSAVISLALKKELPLTEPKQMFRLARIGFASKRKQLHNNLSVGLKEDSQKIKDIFSGFGWDEKIRAQDLSLEDWIKLARRLED